jgi:zinc and cadmium transporter
VTTLAWILASGVAMTALALVGSVTLLLDRRTLDRLVLPLVAFSAGSLLGGAFFHMIPAALGELEPTPLFVWLLAGFVVFFALEQFLHWHHCHRASAECKKPLGYLILIGDGVHNLIGGFAVAGTFLIDIRLGVTTWLAAAAHEVPQELGDFGVLVHSGWSRTRALLFNALSGATFLVGGVLAYAASTRMEIEFLVPFAAGNFIYIGASDLVPEVNKHHSATGNLVHFLAFVAGVALLLALRLGFD